MTPIEMNDKETIFSSIRKALKPISEPKPYPDWSIDLAVSKSGKNLGDTGDRTRRFLENWKLNGGIHCDGLKSLPQFLSQQGVSFGYCTPQLINEISSMMSGIRLESRFDRANVDDYQFSITLANGAIAETGTIILNDKTSVSRLAALTSWIHIAVLGSDSVYSSVGEAIFAFDDDPSIVFVTGPSKTADIEGILIEGVHGPGIQVCCVV